MRQATLVLASLLTVSGLPWVNALAQSQPAEAQTQPADAQTQPVLPPAHTEADAEAKAMHEELMRAQHKLQIKDEPPPYELRLDYLRGQRLAAKASFGALLSSSKEDMAKGRIEVWVGKPGADNRGFLGSMGGLFTLPLHPSPKVSTLMLWRAIDQRYRDALSDRSAKKRQLDDLQDPSPFVLPPNPGPPPDEVQAAAPRIKDWFKEDQLAALHKMLRELSASYVKHPGLEEGALHWQAETLNYAQLDTQGLGGAGSTQRWTLLARLMTRAADGMVLDHAVALHGHRNLPDFVALGAKFNAQLEQAAQQLLALREAPIPQEDYDGPILLAPPAAAALLASSVALHTSGDPAPLSEYGWIEELAPRWQSMLGKEVMPPGFSLIDDPAGLPKGELEGFASMQLDAEGLVPRPLRLIDRGKLQELLMTRRANRYRKQSHARSRITPLLLREASPTHLRLEVEKRWRASLAAMAKDLLRRARNDGYDYAYMIESFRPAHLAGDVPRDSARQDASSRNVIMPLPFVVRRIDASNVADPSKAPMVRGLMVGPMSLRVLRRIRSVGESSQSFAMRVPIGVGGGFATALEPSQLLDLSMDIAVTTPALLVEGMALFAEKGQQEKTPVLGPLVLEQGKQTSP